MILRSCRLFFACVLIVLFRFQEVSPDEGQCTRDEKCSSEVENKYSEAANIKDNVYYKNVEKALQEYVPCVSGDCSCHMATMDNDLKPFQKTGITKKMFEAVRKSGTKYQVISGKLYRQKDCSFPARCSGVEHYLAKLAPSLPDTELIINTRDWPQLSSIRASPLGPVFSFSKTADYWDIMYPAWSFWEGGPAIKLYPTGLGRWDQHRTSLTKAALKWPWESKKPVAFFRGSRTSSERDVMVLLSRSHSELFDAQYTKNQAWKSDADTLGLPPAEEVSLEDHCQYKYLVNYRGVAASFRLKHLFLCRSLVFHVGSDWLEFFYPSLKPWVHYVPVAADATSQDLKQMLEFFQQHDDLARKIAERGHEFVWEHLTIKDVNCYWKKLMKKYSKLLKYDVVKDDELVEVKAK